VEAVVVKGAEIPEMTEDDWKVITMIMMMMMFT
jgi:hypothetical protein